MNRKLVFYYLGRITYAVGALMLLPIIVAIIYGEYRCLSAFILTALIAIALGFCASKLFKTKNTLLFAKEGFAIVALAWIIMSLLGTLPFYISREIPSFVDALFETVSGFTTTGASILKNIEAMSKSLLFWRSFTHWIGGMGVLVFIMALLPNISERSVHIMRAEVPGPIFGKLVPKVRDTAKKLYFIYIGLTTLEVIFLLFGGMSLFESIVHSLSTAGTGGFGITGESIRGYSPYIQWVITAFMLIFGVNFNLYYYFLIKRSISAFKSKELFTYFGIVAVSTGLICANIYNIYGSFSETLRHSAFQVSAIVTTTGFSTADFELWPSFSKALIFVLMFVGGCAGSTAGGLKISRIILTFKMIGAEIKKLLHPRAVTTVRFEGKTVENTTLHSMTVYFATFALCYVAIFLCISFEPFGFTTNFTAVATCLNNVGPGFDLVGPYGEGFSIYSPFSKIVLSFAMLLGRLEIFPLLLTLIPRTWVKD